MRDSPQYLPVTSPAKPSAPRPAPPSREHVRREAVGRAAKQLDWADEESRKLIGECLKPVGVFFDRAKDGLPAFAEEALGWTSKRYLAADCVWPWSSGNWQQNYLLERWEQQVFSTAALGAMIERVAKRYAVSLDDIEQQMLVRLRLDVDDLPREALPELANEQQLANRFRDAIEVAVKHAQADVAHEVGLFVVAEIAERVLAMVVSRLGLSATVLGTGAAASPYTAGLSLLGALVINYLLDLVWDWYADPQGNLVKEIGSQLDRLRRLIVEGDGTALGLRGELEEYVRRRARLRAEALAALLDPEK